MMFLSLSSVVKDILNGFKDLLNFVIMLTKFVKNFAQQIVYLITYILKAISLATAFILTLPVWLQTFASITLAICVLYIMLGRKSGAD